MLSDRERERLFDFDNVIILRSLTKIFHLSGVRIGYVVANEEIISRLKALQPTWSVNSIAQELALGFYIRELFIVSIPRNLSQASGKQALRSWTRRCIIS